MTEIVHDVVETDETALAITAEWEREEEDFLYGLTHDEPEPEATGE